MNLLLLIIIELTCVIIALSNPIVKIKNGTLEGIFMESRKGRKFAAFMGIPYALPPVGDLRFEPPKPASSWSQILSVKKHSKQCTQKDIFFDKEEVSGDEDCLYLNVYTPAISDQLEKNEKYPVIIFIHGGGLVCGSGDFVFTGPKYLMDHNVILVTLNYRLGPLGFLSTGDSVILGNQALKDQAQVIRWVNENIEKFGGDSSEITLSGHSAGAACVEYHMLSPLSKGLFQRAISQSGTVLSPWAFKTVEEAKNNAQKLGTILKCPINNSTQLLDCLRKKRHIDIINAADNFKIFDYCPVTPFGPVAEPHHPGAFLSEDPKDLLKNGKIMNVPWMSGFTSQEGGVKSAKLKSTNKLIEMLDENFEKIAPVTIMLKNRYPQHVHKKIVKRIQKFYFGEGHINESITTGLTDMYSDSWLIFPIYNALKYHSKIPSSKVYFYHFEYNGSTSFCKLYDKIKNYGICHGDELQYLFPIRDYLFQDTPITDEDNKMIELMTKLWFNFISSGNPTPDESEVLLIWEPIRTHSLEHLHIRNSTCLFMEKNFCQERMRFWETLSEDDSTLSQGLKDEL